MKDTIKLLENHSKTQKNSFLAYHLDILKQEIKIELLKSNIEGFEEANEVVSKYLNL